MYSRETRSSGESSFFIRDSLLILTPLPTVSDVLNSEVVGIAELNRP